MKTLGTEITEAIKDRDIRVPVLKNTKPVIDAIVEAMKKGGRKEAVVTLALFFLYFCQPAMAAMEQADIAPLVEKIIIAESSGRHWVSGDGGKARGLMQIQKGTWERFTKESWARAFDPVLNRKVGMLIVQDIIRRYGNRATPARVVYTYNTGRFLKAGTSIPGWTLRHPNRIYRQIFVAEVVPHG